MPESIMQDRALLLEQAFSSADLMVAQVETFVLVLVRVSFIVFLLPFLSSPNVGVRLKAGLSFFVSLAIYPSLEATVTLQSGSAFLLWMVLKECLVGFLIGYAGYFLFAFVEFGAEIINREIGLTAMPIVDPSNGEMTNELSQVIVMTFSILFLLTGGHTVLFEAVTQSFHYIPIGMINYQAEPAAKVATAMVAESILYGFRFAAPVFVTMTLLALALAFMSRVMPQMNVWVISVPIKVFVGILTLIFALPLMYQLFGMVFDRTYRFMHLLLKMNAPAKVSDVSHSVASLWC